MKNGDKPVYPIVNSDGFPSRLDTVTILADNKDATGLTKREYFAGLAMQGLISQSSEEVRLDTALEIPSNTAKWAVRFADELLKQLEA